MVADQIVFADLGAETADGFRPLSALGFGHERYPVDAELARQLAHRTGGVLGTVLTVTTVTGSEDTRRRSGDVIPTLERRPWRELALPLRPRGSGSPFAEVRAISNVVGPRDRAGLADRRRARRLWAGRWPQCGDAHMRLAFSPCPNDTFVFHAWTHGLLDGAPPTRGHLRRHRHHEHRGRARRVRRGQGVLRGAAVAARSTTRCCRAAARSAAAAVRSCSPAATDRSSSAVARSRCRASARPRTCCSGCGRAAQRAGSASTSCRSPRSCPRCATGRYDAGLVIHEARFTYPDYGLTALVDLGAWWEADTGLPIPLGAILARRELDADALADVVRASVEYAWAHPRTQRAYVAEHADEMSPDVQAQHIELYVNEFTRDLGERGLRRGRDLARPGARCRTHAERPSPAVTEGGEEPLGPQASRLSANARSSPATLRASPLSG